MAADVPEDYESRVQYILDNNIEDLGVELTFSDEVMVPVRELVML